MPKTRDSARRLGLVTLAQMLTELVAAVENPLSGIQVVEVPLTLLPTTKPVKIRQKHPISRLFFEC